ncbi:MAG: hypothetical protein M1472_05765 [Planctomycetes bacterium]|nr:hypothetical protein [Planctomycetota bacterium]
MLRFGASYPHGAFGPVYLAPTQLRRFGIDAKPTVTCQGHQKPPFRIWTGVNHLIDGSLFNEGLPGFIRPYVARHSLEGIIAPVDALLDGRLKELFGNAGLSPNTTVGGQAVIHHEPIKSHGFGGCDLIDRPVFTKTLHQPSSRLFIVMSGIGFPIKLVGNIPLYKAVDTFSAMLARCY